jgi:hypothetical protein
MLKTGIFKCEDASFVLVAGGIGYCAAGYATLHTVRWSGAG